MSELDVIPEAPEVEPVEQETAEAEVAEQQAEAVEETVEEPATSDDAQPEKPKRRSRAEERINALTKEKYEAQKAVEAAQAQVRQYEEYIRQQQAQPQTAEMPKLSDYDYDEGRYQQAVQSWNQQQWQTYQEQQSAWQQQQSEREAQERKAQAWQAKIAEGVEKHPDFMVKVGDPSLPGLANTPAFDAMMSSDKTAEVMYYLASNPQEAFAIASMDQSQAIRKVVEIEYQLSAKPVAQKIPPPPPPTVKGNSEAEVDPQKLTTEEWMAWRNRQLQSKR